MRDLRIVFMGTPEFAVPSLEALVREGFQVVGVITAPDKPSGRGRKLSASPVKQTATELGIPVLQPTNLKSPDFHEELKALKPNLQVVVAFRMLPEVVWSFPEYGTFNLHASLLPDYRGAAPINWAVINGEKKTGLTTFFLKHEIDTGNILFQEEESISYEDTVGTLYERLRFKGAELVVKTARAIQAETDIAHPQDNSRAIHKAPKISRETCKINWNQSPDEIYNFVRGLSPYPAAWTELNGAICKVFAVEEVDEFVEKKYSVGDYLTDNKTYLYFCVGNGNEYISIRELQMAGKRRMNIGEFLMGNTL